MRFSYGLVYIGRDVLESTRTWWVGRGINGGSADLERGAMIYLYGVETFALAVFIYCTARQFCQKLVAVTVSMLGVLDDTSYTLGPSSRAPILERLAKAAYSHTATQPQI
jgi:hypothetical protein